MKLKPRPPYFIVKVSKEDMQDRREKIGSLYLHPSFVYMTRECQASEIVAIGSEAKEYFPEAEEGHILIYHHFITGKTTDNRQAFHLVDSDDNFNYYSVNAFALPGERNLAYGVWNGKEIIPNLDYLFLSTQKKEKQDPNAPDGMVVSAGGLFIPQKKKRTRAELSAIMKQNMATIQQISPLIQYTKEAQERAASLEAENERISKELNKKYYEYFPIAAVNPFYNADINESFGMPFNIGDEAVVLNIAAHTTIEFNKIEYIVVDTKYVMGPAKWYRSAVSSFKKRVINKESA